MTLILDITSLPSSKLLKLWNRQCFSTSNHWTESALPSRGITPILAQPSLSYLINLHKIIKSLNAFQLFETKIKIKIKISRFRIFTHGPPLISLFMSMVRGKSMITVYLITIQRKNSKESLLHVCIFKLRELLHGKTFN